MQSLALLEARRRGDPAFPVLRVVWTSRALDLGTGVYSPTMRETAAGGVTAVTRLGGWGTIKYGSGINDSGLKAVETSVSVSDPSGDLINMLETYDPRGSQAVIDWASPGLALADWEPVFSGVVMDWARDNLHTKLILKTDDTLLRSPVPPGVYNRAEWGSASEATIYGTSMPLILGVHDSWQVTQRGMVAATNIRYDKEQGYWWLASVDRMIEVTRIYFDGIPQGTGGWSVLRGVYGQSFLTIIVLATGYQPEKGVVVAFDCEAMDENGLTSGSALTGAPDQLRAILEEYTFRPAPLRGWRGPLSICEPTSWDAVSEFFALHKIESAHKTGGDQEPENAAAVVESFLAAYTWVRMWWTETGQIAIGVIDPDEESDPSAAGWLDLQKHHEGGQVPFQPGDRREVYTHIKMPFMWSSAEQKYLTAYEAHDVAALPEKLELSTDNPWSQCRFGDPTGFLNPAPPADPALPPLPSPSQSPSASWSPSASESQSISPSASWSPSASSSRSQSPSSSQSPSASTSSSPSPSPAYDPRDFPLYFPMHEAGSTARKSYGTLSPSGGFATNAHARGNLAGIGYVGAYGGDLAFGYHQRFDASLISIGTSGSHNPENGMTLAFWLYMQNASYNGSQFYFALGPAFTPPYGVVGFTIQTLSGASHNIGVSVFDSGGFIYSSAYTLVSNSAWHSMVISYTTGGTIDWWIDGVSNLSASTGGTFGVGSLAIKGIWASAPGGGPGSGYAIDEVVMDTATWVQADVDAYHALKP